MFKDKGGHEHDGEEKMEYIFFKHSVEFKQREIKPSKK